MSSNACAVHRAVRELLGRLISGARNPPGVILVLEHALAIYVVHKTAGYVASVGLRGALRDAAGVLVRSVKALPGARGLVEQEKRETLAKIEEFVVGNDEEPEELRLHELPGRGWGRDRIFARFEELKKHEEHFVEGRAFGGVYHPLHDELHKVQCDAYVAFSDTNALYPAIFRGVRKFEAELVSMAVRLLHGGEDACGSLTSGGTESILCMVKAYRDHALRTRGIRRPEFIVPVTAHAAIDKACEYFGVKLVHVPVTQDQRVDVDAVRRALNQNTIAIYASAPTFPHGVIDPIERLGEVARAAGVGLHVDNCMGGFICSFLEREGLLHAGFDFRVPGVTSISMDLHKYGLCQKGASVVCYSTRELRRHQYCTVTDWPGGMYCTATMQGSRNGGIIATTWATLAFNGCERYAVMARKVHSVWQRLRDTIPTIPCLELVGEPDACIIAFTAKGCNIYEVADVMERKGWALPRLQYPPAVHVCVSERMEPLVEEWISDLREAVALCRDSPEQVKDGMAGIYGSAAIIPDRSLVGELLEGYLDSLYLVSKERR
mmetsp:Transcript_20684/g.66401  ORF Transcript_20684/g.66401 Transcript_20684/m.66401 type:complete len:550 (+) Transcript_20684:1-1650(+)